MLFRSTISSKAAKLEQTGNAPDEMVQWGEKIPMDDFNDQVLADYRDKLISILLDSDRQDKERDLMMQWARENKSWLAVAEQWIKEFES